MGEALAATANAVADASGTHTDTGGFNAGFEHPGILGYHPGECTVLASPSCGKMPLEL
jgi:hypothetical protein